MSSECFPLHAEKLCENEIGVFYGNRDWAHFAWTVHAEAGMELIVAAGGVTDAWGNDYTVEEFVEKLRGVRQTVGRHSCALTAFAERAAQLGLKCVVREREESASR